MDYNHVTLYLAKFKKLLSQKEVSHHVIAETISKHIGHPIDIRTIKVKSTTIHIEGSPILRNEILIHKEDILADLQKCISENNITNIR